MNLVYLSVFSFGTTYEKMNSAKISFDLFIGQMQNIIFQIFA